MHGMKMNFFGHEVSSILNGILIQTGLRVMLEGKGYRPSDLSSRSSFNIQEHENVSRKIISEENSRSVHIYQYSGHSLERTQPIILWSWFSRVYLKNSELVAFKYSD